MSSCVYTGVKGMGIQSVIALGYIQCVFVYSFNDLHLVAQIFALTGKY